MRGRRWQQSLLLAVCLISAPAFGQTPAAVSDETKAKEAQAFVDTWNDKGRELCEDNAPGCAAAGLSLVRAAELFEEAHQRTKAIVTRTIILEPRYHLDYTEYGKKTLFEIAEDWKAVAEYDRAAGYLETLGRKFPAMEEAPLALTDAVVFRLALGDVAAAKKNVELYAKNYGSKKPVELTKMFVGMGLWLEEQGDEAESKKWIKSNMPLIDRSGTVDLRFRAHVLFGRLLSHEGDVKGAAAEYEVVRTAYQNPESVLKDLRAAETDEATVDRKTGQVLMAVGEALFFAAEQKRADVDAIRFPEYKGSGDMTSVLKHINTKVKDWMVKKREALEVTERAYMAILSLQPVAPPRWVIAASARVGQLRAKFAAEFRAAPVPKEWRSNGLIPNTNMTYTELRNMYYEAIDQASAPLRDTAKAAFETCQKYSVQFQWADENTRTCDQWLAKYDRKRHIPVVEFIPKLVGSSVRIVPEPVPEPVK